MDFDVVVPDVEELEEGEPREVVLENARRKAEAVDGPVVMAADTEVVLDGKVLGKPAGEDEARAYLRALSGRTHTVLGGMVVLRTSAGGKRREERSGVAASEVTFRQLDEVTLDLYLASGEWRDRAGAYAIQGLGSILIARLEGDFSNVVGLPVPLLLELAPELV